MILTGQRLKFHLISCLFLTCSTQFYCQDDIVNFKAFETSQVKNLSNANTPNIEFSPAIYRKGIVFVSSQPIDSTEQYDKSIKEAFFNFRYIDLSYSGAHSSSIFNNLILPKLHLGPLSFDKDDKIMFYSQNDISQKGPDGKYLMKLSVAENDGRSWYYKMDFIHNGNNYSIVHPSLNENGDMLFFASDMPGGFGKLDLYLCRKENGVWSEPENLGDFINTEENDLFPFFFRNEFLFYASNGQEGYGGLDMYVTKITDGSWSFPQNLGQPLNSDQDDMGIVLMEDAKKGFFGSSRPGGKGKDDIYSVEFIEAIFPMDTVMMETETPPATIDFSIRVLNKQTKIPISEAQIQFIPINLLDEDENKGLYEINIIDRDEKSGELVLKMKPSLNKLKGNQSVFTDSSGYTSIPITEDTEFLLNISKEGFLEEQTILDASVLVPEIFLMLEPIPEPEPIDNILIPTKVGDVMVFDHLYYAYDRAEIEPGAAIELDALAKVMKENPTMKIELSAHTDSRGPKDYNQKLSQKRAEVAKRYLVDLGIAPDRIESVGHGELFLRNHCADGIQCTELEHGFNRRTEVKVIEE